MKSRDIVVDIKRKKLVAGIKGQDPVLKVQFPTPPLSSLSFPS
jgi:hypothetical protein